MPKPPFEEVSLCYQIKVLFLILFLNHMKGYMYILLCDDGTYYTGSTKDLELRIQQHQAGLGANYTRNRLPVELIYWEEYKRIDMAFYREKQIQGWSRAKKEALMRGDIDELQTLSKPRRRFFRK